MQSSFLVTFSAFPSVPIAPMTTPGLYILSASGSLLVHQLSSLLLLPCTPNSLLFSIMHMTLHTVEDRDTPRKLSTLHTPLVCFFGTGTSYHTLFPYGRYNAVLPTYLEEGHPYIQQTICHHHFCPDIMLTWSCIFLHFLQSPLYLFH